jgi:hypothetical protein
MITQLTKNNSDNVDLTMFSEIIHNIKINEKDYLLHIMDTVENDHCDFNSELYTADVFLLVYSIESFKYFEALDVSYIRNIQRYVKLFLI